jgi:HPt (histidine-containing phosphotransfer) domain-containing protein
MSEENIVYVDEDLEELIPEFIENRQEDIGTIKKLLETGDLQEIQRLGHSMKGSGGGYGFPELTRIGSVIEEAAKAGEVKIIDETNDYLAHYLSTVKIVYQEVEE